MATCHGMPSSHPIIRESSDGRLLRKRARPVSQIMRNVVWYARGRTINPPVGIATMPCASELPSSISAM